jgi:hypothetical protein
MSIWTQRAVGGGNLPDIEEVRRALTILPDPEFAVELQCFPSAKTHVVPAADVAGNCRLIEEMAPGSEGVYWMLNPLPLDLAGKLEPGKGAKIADIVRRRWLLIDVDRIKTPEDKNLSATEAEKEACRTLALAVLEFLTGLGWPQPVLIDSGNGFHLLFRIDLPADDASRVLLRKLLKALGEKFDTASAEIDQKVHNANRVSKLPGTWARKGEPSEERPHRLSLFLRVPSPAEIVPAELLERTLNGLVGGRAEVNGHVNGHGNPFVATAGDGISAAYARSALERECGRMALTTPGDLNEQLFKSAAALGNFVGSGLLDEAVVFDALSRAAKSAGCDNQRKDEDTIRRGIETGKATPRSAPEANGAHPAAKQQAAPFKPGQPRQPIPESRRPKIYTLPDLLATEFPPPNWAIPGLLSEGLTFLAGKPKLGKSWMAINIALTIAVGGKALGTTQVLPGDVLYLSLEDRWRRVKDRAWKVLKGLDIEASKRLEIAVEWPRQDQGGLEAICEWAERVERPTLVIIDTWARFRPISKGSRSAYDQDYEHVAALKGLIDHYGSSCLPVHHCKKAAAEDVVDELSGTLGLAGASDGTLVLTRARAENEAELFITGRDIEEKHLALEFDSKAFTWKSLGTAAERTESKYKSLLVPFFKANAGACFSVAELAERLGVTEENHKNTFRQVLARMADSDLIARVRKGVYRWPVNDGPDEGTAF